MVTPANTHCGMAQEAGFSTGNPGRRVLQAVLSWSDSRQASLEIEPRDRSSEK